METHQTEVLSFIFKERSGHFYGDPEIPIYHDAIFGRIGSLQSAREHCDILKFTIAPPACQLKFENGKDVHIHYHGHTNSERCLCLDWNDFQKIFELLPLLDYPTSCWINEKTEVIIDKRKSIKFVSKKGVEIPLEYAAHCYIKQFPEDFFNEDFWTLDLAFGRLIKVSNLLYLERVGQEKLAIDYEQFKAHYINNDKEKNTAKGV